MSENEPEVVILATKILARLLVVHGRGYVKKFSEKTGGFAIMRHRLKRWWHVPTLWPICFAILFGYDVAIIDFERSFHLFGLLELFAVDGEAEVVYPEALQVLIGMLQSGLKMVFHAKEGSEPGMVDSNTGSPISKPRHNRSMSAPKPPGRSSFNHGGKTNGSRSIDSASPRS